MAHEIGLPETIVDTLELFETEEAERIINKGEDIGDFPDHTLDRLPTYSNSTGAPQTN